MDYMIAMGIGTAFFSLVSFLTTLLMYTGDRDDPFLKAAVKWNSAAFMTSPLAGIWVPIGAVVLICLAFYKGTIPFFKLIWEVWH